MTLTRHFYDLNEVIAALEYCLRNGYGRSQFWAWELLVSWEQDRVVDTLRNLWLREGGAYDLNLAQDLMTPPTQPRGWVTLLLRVKEAIQKASSLTAIRFLNNATVPDELSPIFQTYNTKQRSEAAAAFVSALDPAETISNADAQAWWLRMDYACHQRSRRHAAWLLQAVQSQLSADGIWAGLKQMAPELARLQAATPPRPDQQILAQMNALLYLCTAERETILDTPKNLPVDAYERDWMTWSRDVGRRAARVYAIPADALHQGTARGQLPSRYTNVDELREPLALLATEGCKFWRDRLEEAGVTLDAVKGAVVYPDDDVMEDFIDTYFPDDLPDEWSAADQAKSHGRGCQEKATAPPPSIHIMDESVPDEDWQQVVIAPTKKLTSVSAGGS